MAAIVYTCTCLQLVAAIVYTCTCLQLVAAIVYTCTCLQLVAAIVYTCTCLQLVAAIVYTCTCLQLVAAIVYTCTCLQLVAAIVYTCTCLQLVAAIVHEAAYHFYDICIFQLLQKAVHSSHFNCRVILYSIGQGSPTYDPRAKSGPFQKKLWPFLTFEKTLAVLLTHRRKL